MKILILSQYYDPEPVEKVADQALGLSRMGHEVEVLTGFPCYPHGKTYPGFRQKITHIEQRDGVRVIRIPQIPDHSRSVLRLALYYFSFAFSAMLIGVWRVRKADVILVYQSALPTGLAAWWISLWRRIPYMLDVVDLWPESVMASGMMQNRVLLGMVRSLAYFVYSRANHLSVITEGYRDRLVEMGIPSERISVIYHWKRSELYGVVPADPEFAASEGLAGKVNIIYTGNVGLFQRLEIVLECAELLRDSHPDLQFVIVGDGLELPRLETLAEETSLHNVRFAGRRPPEQMNAFFSLADALLVHLERTEMADVSIPSKTISYLAAGRPILMGVAGESTRFIDANECGICFVPQDANSLAAAVLEIYRASPQRHRDWCEASRRAFENHFVPDQQLGKMVQELSQLAQRRAA